MIKKIINILTLVVVGLILLLIDIQYPDVSFQKGYATAFAVAGCYLLLKLLIDEFVIKNIQGAKTRYSLRKVTSMFFVILLVIVILRIWLPNAQALLVSYGLIAAGVAISLQDLFRNIVGGILIFTSGLYNVGDRIEVDGKSGDVIDIGIMYTSLLEIREWVGGDQATGRIISLPNGSALSRPLHNYTKDHNFIWDEIMLPITYQSDWNKALKIISKVVTKETKINTLLAEKEFSALENKYYVSKRNVVPDVFLTPTDNWIEFRIRYITPVRERRLLHNRLVKLILKGIQGKADITIASTTLDIVGVPELQIKQ